MLVTCCSDDDLSALASEMGLEGATKEDDRSFDHEQDGQTPPISVVVHEPSSTELPEVPHPAESQSCEPQQVTSTKVSKKKKKKSAQQS